MIVACVVFLGGASAVLSQMAARSPLLDPSDKDGVPLTVSLEWVNAAETAGHHGVIAKILLLPDKIVVTRWSLAPEASDIQRGCGKRLTAGPDGKLSIADMQMILDCESRASIENTTRPFSHGVILPLVSQPKHCVQTKLPNGNYEICAELLQIEPDRIRMRYEEDTYYDGKLDAHLTLFDIFLQRYAGPLSGRISGCTAKIVTAFSFNPRKPSKLVPYDHASYEHCERAPTY